MTVSPFQAATDVLDRADGVLKLDVPGTPTLVREDLRRLAWTMGVAAIDTQLHWLIRRIDLKATLPSALGRVPIRFDDLIEANRLSVENRRLGRIDRPTTRARNVLNEVILKRTFQSADQVQEALSMIGVAKAFPAISAAMVPSEPPAAIKDHLDRLTHRRNAIVHEGDLARLIRPQRVKRGEIASGDVTDELRWIRRFTRAIDVITK